jgi:hypothetical protein
MNDMPHELALGDVYLSPVLPVFTIALLATWFSISLLNRMRLARYIMFPSLTFLALMTFYVVLMNAFWIKI